MIPSRSQALPRAGVEEMRDIDVGRDPDQLARLGGCFSQLLNAQLLPMATCFIRCTHRRRGFTEDHAPLEG